MSKNKNLKQVADQLFKDYPKESQVFVTTDGQGFFNKNYTVNHCNKNKLEYQEFFRSGYAPEVDQGVEDLLVTAEETIRSHEATLNKIQDLANVEGEELSPEVTEDDHEAVKAVGELRGSYEDLKADLSSAQAMAVSHKTLLAGLAPLLEGNDTKLAKEIQKLMPENTEE